MRSFPMTTFCIMSFVLIFGLSYMVRIFERPYYEFAFQDQDGLHFYTFQSMSSTLWFTIITMTSVGYGGIIASTPLGRLTTILITTNLSTLYSYQGKVRSAIYLGRPLNTST